MLYMYTTSLPSSRKNYTSYKISGDVIISAVDVQLCGVNS